MANLFAAGQQAGPKPLVQFRAGKMFKEGNLVKPDKRKGLITLTMADDMLIHFQWKDRYTGTVEEDLVIFPDEAVFSRVEKCTTGRVYLLDFKGTNRQIFYWVQEPKEDKDEENCEKINQFINNPPPLRGGNSAAGGGQEAASGAGGSSSAPGMLGQLDRNQLMGLLANLSGGSGAGAAAAGGSGAPATAAASGAGGGGVELEALQSILQGLGGAVPGASAPSSNQPKPASAQPAPPSVTDLNLQHVLDASEISSAAQASAEEFVKRLSEHLPPLPEGVSQEQHLLENLRSGQLRQTVGLFQSALSEPQSFNEIMTSFGLQPSPTSNAPFGAQAFLDAILHAASQSGSSQSGGSQEQKKDDAEKKPKDDDKMEE
eukprot:CAMPEP_0174302734 /NCGR_PEP_ID=MMETSP0809-20121228/59783_1 /TAXON_ID=73025 ORGANISM="Eutreptiella gymnastica-like, Strain CCMP1594" /NCGR_SAMPLE_ID=MMETSP0809 /ASSEMBLY_ACC=CAM_ASM_000658 /LENGTH=373 /DNA_ID=CAMNT_0015408657 /DNA_START=26 /DNA_END=1147 /DNA_ORIENTATION=-